MVGAFVSYAVLGATVLASSLGSEFPEQERKLVAATSAFFDVIEAPDRATKVDFFTEAYSTAIPLDEWQNERLRELVDKGPLRGLTAYRITWYPVDTLLGAVDFVGRDGDDDDLVCGYVLWEFPQDAEPQLRWYEATHLDPGEISALSVEEAGARLLEANCAFTDLDANFALSAE